MAGFLLNVEALWPHHAETDLRETNSKIHSSFLGQGQRRRHVVVGNDVESNHNLLQRNINQALRDQSRVRFIELQTKILVSLFFFNWISAFPSKNLCFISAGSDIFLIYWRSQSTLVRLKFLFKTFLVEFLRP